jgi:hypothetical protein
LKDDYQHDGRVLFEALSPKALPLRCRRTSNFSPFWRRPSRRSRRRAGELGARTLTGIATRAAEGDTATYATLDAEIKAITTRRDEIGSKMITMLEDAAFNGKPIDPATAAVLIKEADDLLGVAP